MNIIDNLEIPLQRVVEDDEMERYEFFECDYCGNICRMPIEEYKTYSEAFVLSAKFKCQTCTKNNKTVTKDQRLTKDKYIELREAGQDKKEIAKTFGMSISTLYNHLKKWGVNPKA